MSATVENLEKNKIKITFSISPEKFEEGIQKAYNKNKGRFDLPGFRKGKVPRKFIEMNYGKEIFFEDAINIVLPEAYDNAVKENNLDTVSRPEIGVTSVSAEEGAVITAEVYIKPEVTVNNYKGLTYKKFNETATDEEINAEINSAREKNSRIISIEEDREAQMGDIVVIDFEGFIYDKPFEGGKADNYELTLGSHTFIDNFEEQIVGKKIGDEFEVLVKFPNDYGKEDLQGANAKFKVFLHEIKFKELPELNDEFAQDVSEFDTLEEYKNDIIAKIESKKKEQSSSDKENQIIKALVENNPIDLPESMVESQVDSMINDFARRLQSQGMNLETYLKYTGMDENAFRESYKPMAEAQVKGRLCLEAIAKTENFAISDEEYEAEVERIASTYQMEKEKLLSVIQEKEKESLIEDLQIKKALDLVITSAKEVE